MIFNVFWRIFRKFEAEYNYIMRRGPQVLIWVVLKKFLCYNLLRIGEVKLMPIYGQNEAIYEDYSKLCEAVEFI